MDSRLVSALMMVLAVAGAAVVLAALGEEGQQPPAEGFETYSILVQRNIFDPQRRPAPTRGAEESPVEESPPDLSVSLLGTWVSSGRTMALLGSPSAEYNGDRAAGEELGGWKIESITTKGVVLVRGDQRLDWPVGQKVVRLGEEGWQVAGQAEPGRSPTTSSGSASGGSSEGILEKLRKRRKRETGDE
jgi:hypothetical protein